MASSRSLIFALIFSGCTAEIETHAPPTTPISPVDVVPPCSISIPTIDGQRLTKLEYNNVIRDLFGLTDDFAANFADPQPGSAGFTTESDAQNLSPEIVQDFYYAANTVADSVFAQSPNRFLTCSTGDTCATKLITDLATRAFRRPPTTDEVTALLTLSKTTTGTFADGMKLAVTGVLMSPQFLFRTWDLPADATATTTKLDDYQLASRLSFFMWGTIPDAVLLAAAADGTLHATLPSQVQRMMKDPKAEYLADTFSTQWLGMGDLQGQERTKPRYPLWSPAMQASMQGETMAFMKNVILNDASVMDFIEGEYTFADKNVSQIYGAPGTFNANFTRITDDTHRVGILTQPAILTLTSKGDATSPVRRGKWVLTQLLCSSPPPPPADVPALPQSTDGGVYPESQIQQRMAQHESQGTSCYACHHAMDPIGMAFENFDAMGYYRAAYLDGVSVNASGKLPTGEQLDSVVDLANVLKTDARFPTCFAAKLSSFAQGIDMTTSSNRCGLTPIASTSIGTTHTMSELITAIVTDDTFLTRTVRP